MKEKAVKCQKKACAKAKAPAAKAPAKKEEVKKEVVKEPAKKRVTFSVTADPGSEVSVAGEFNNWDPEGKKMTDKKNNGVYTATVMLAPGTYEYKFIINKTWCVDPTCKEWIQNSLGTLNSVLRVE